jgi:N-acetylglucosaminyldiphosphoundecaprenol N-acetyl-beta-D-mannosaminyltransferase
VVRARRDGGFRNILERADLVVADGMAVMYAAHLLGTPLKQNIVGRYLLPLLAACSAAKGYRLFVVGGSSADVASQAVERLRGRHPGVAIVGWYTPPFVRHLEEDEAEVTRIVEAVNAADADVLFVCLGTPKQEKLIANVLHRLNVKVAVGIGAALEILSGRIHEPPRWATAVGVEWVFRLLQEPRRLARRYLWDDPRLFFWVLKQRMGSPFAGRSRGGSAPS